MRAWRRRRLTTLADLSDLRKMPIGSRPAAAKSSVALTLNFYPIRRIYVNILTVDSRRLAESPLPMLIIFLHAIAKRLGEQCHCAS